MPINVSPIAPLSSQLTSSCAPDDKEASTTPIPSNKPMETTHFRVLKDQHSSNDDVQLVSSNNSSSGSETPTTPRPPMRNPSRERKRAELVTLRQEAEALERQRNLLLLKRKQTVQTPLSNHEQWKRTVETERLLRQRAEAENQRLFEMLQHQFSLSHAFESRLSKRARTEEVVDASFPMQYDTSIGMLHAQFSRDILRIYKAGIDRIFHGVEWTDVCGELGCSIIREEKIDPITNNRMVEMRETRHVPFEYERVAEAMWRCAQHPFAADGRLIESYHSPENQIAIKYRAATPGNQHRGDLLTAVMVLQKFEEVDRTVQVWRIMSASTEAHASEAERAFSDETGWVIIEPVPPGVPGMEPGTAVVRLVAQLVPLWPHGHPSENTPSKLQADDFHDLVVKASCEDMVALGDAVGSLLLDESLGLVAEYPKFDL